MYEVATHAYRSKPLSSATMVGNAVPTTVWSSATSMVTNEIPIIASSDSRNGKTCPLEWWAAVWTAIFC